MECLYGDLNNYEDVRTLEELRAKNKELKVKLEEHSAAKEKLQKDYDNLKIKFKQLENNYSSLLVTARSELQRKTQLTTIPITTEKDLMVLNAFKSGRNIKRNFDTGVKNPDGKKEGKPTKRNINTKEDTVKQKNVDIKQVRRDARVLPAKDADLDPSCLARFFCKYNRNKTDNTGVNVELFNKWKNNVNENIVQHKTELNEPPKITASSITDRRKSTLTVSIPFKAFSSSDFLRKYRKLPDDYPSRKCARYLGRSLESPLPEISSYSRRQHSKAVPRSDYDRYPHDQENCSYYHDDKYSAKCRSKDYDDTLIKRQRTESYEIMATAATTLGDPRVTSNRYVIRKENGKEVLTTVVGRNIDIIPVNKVMWNIKPVDIPVSLQRRPSKCSDQLAKVIYMDINNPVTNLGESMESGEVRRTGHEIHDFRSKLKKIQHNAQDVKLSKQPLEEISKQPANATTVSKTNIEKYRIPKNRQFNKNTHSTMGVPIINLAENVPHHKNDNVNRKGEAEDSVPKELKPHIQQYNNMRKDIVPNSKLDDHNKSKSRQKSESQYQSSLTGMASDLELSEDTSDHMNTKIRVVPEKVQKHCEIPLNMNEVRSKDSVNSVENKRVANSHNTEIKSTDSTKKLKTKKKQSKSKEIFNDSVENTGELIQVLENKRKSKKEQKSTLKETKETFWDLFGDSSSLITPEDLGIPYYLPISEDAQDDMKIHQIAAPLLYKDEIPGHIPHQQQVEVIIQKKPAHDNIPKADLNNNNDIEEKNTSSKTLTYTKLPSPIIYEKLFPGSDLDSNVVKTVIISAGILPEIEDENKKEVTKPDTYVKVNDIQNTKHILKPSANFPSIIYKNLYPGSDLNDPNVVIISTGTQPEIEYENKKNTTQNTEDILLLPATKRLKKDTLKACPMYTLHKDFTAMNPLEADAAITDAICDPCESQAVATITNSRIIAPVANQTEKNTLESNDEPDVRIVVKSRRKVVKRSPTLDNRN